MNQVKNLRGEQWELIRFKKKTNQKRYYVSNKGRVKSVDKVNKEETLLKSSLDNRGCHRISVRLKEGNGHIFVHKEVAKKFVKRNNPRKEKFVIHKNYNKEDNLAKNLKWVDIKGLYAYVKERQEALGIKRKRPSHVKMTEPQVALLKKYLNKGKQTRKQLSERFGITSTQIKRIERGENWAHVEAKK